MDDQLRHDINPEAARKLGRMRRACVLILLSWLFLSNPARTAPPAAMFAPQQSIEDLAGRAEQFEREGKLDDAESAYREILKIDPQSVAALNRLGAIEVQRGRFSDGIRFYRRALEISPSEFVTNLNLGIAYIKKQDFGSAVGPLERAARSAPESLQAHELLAGALVGQNQFLRAIPELEKARALNPDDLPALYLLQRSYLETKQYEKALAAFDRLQALDPDSPWVRILRGQAEDGLGNYPKAIEEFEAARTQLPRDATVRFSLGFMYWKIRRLADAEKELVQALRLDPAFDEAKYYLADAYILEEKPAAALPLLDPLVRSDPTNARALADQGKALEQLNRNAESAQAYEACLRADPGRADAHYRLARVYKKLNRPGDERRELAVAKSLQKKKRDEQETLMQATGTRGDPTRQGEAAFPMPGSENQNAQ